MRKIIRGDEKIPDGYKVVYERFLPPERICVKRPYHIFVMWMYGLWSWVRSPFLKKDRQILEINNTLLKISTIYSHLLNFWVTQYELCENNKIGNTKLISRMQNEVLTLLPPKKEEVKDQQTINGDVKHGQ